MVPSNRKIGGARPRGKLAGEGDVDGDGAILHGTDRRERRGPRRLPLRVVDLRDLADGDVSLAWVSAMRTSALSLVGLATAGRGLVPG